MSNWKKKTLIPMIIKIICFGVISIALITACVIFLINCYQIYYNIWLSEFNAQIAAYGFYKSDIYLIDHHLELLKWNWLFAGAILTGIAGVVFLTLFIVKIVHYRDYYERIGGF